MSRYYALVIPITSALFCLAAKAATDPLIEAARQTADTYEQSLPDYIVTRSIIRYRGSRRHPNDDLNGVQLWIKVDTVSADVTVWRGKETYSNIILDGKPAADLPDWGAWSAGEFSAELSAILQPERAASFARERTEKLGNRSAVRYRFTVDAAHSTWHIAADHLHGQSSPQTLTPGYKGEIWIDSKTGQVLRIQMAARGLPEWFALSTVQSDTEYWVVPIGQTDSVLPTHSVSVTCERNGLVCLKNETTFRNYDKFTASTRVTFEGVAK